MGGILRPGNYSLFLTFLAVGGALPKLAGETAPVRGMVWGGRFIPARLRFVPRSINEERGVEIRSGGGAICSHYYRVYLV